jgi:uncharacterized OB-fold protein
MLDKISQPGLARRVRGEVPIYHRYTLGVAGERFFKAMRDDQQILVSPCPKCRSRLLPPKIYCETCFVETSDNWEPLSGPGFIPSFTIVHRSLEEELLETPEIVALVSWEGVRGGLIHRLREVEPDRITIGMAVEPVWAGERAGAMSDISHFRPFQLG